jgi:hypothetical protein
MSLKAQLHDVTTATAENYSRIQLPKCWSFATLNLSDGNGGQLQAFLSDPDTARLIAAKALEIAKFLDEERAIAEVALSMRVNDMVH